MAKKKTSKPSTSKKPAKADDSARPALPVDRRSMEKTMADLQRIMSEQHFESIDEANSFIQNLLQQTGGFVPDQAAESPLEKAQDLMYKAWEATGKARRVKIAKQALEISPDCADAYVLLAEETANTPAEAKVLYEKAVKAAEHALGPDAIKEYEGDFWMVMETRPYMRARLGLAQCLLAMGEKAQAAEHFTEILRLNPGDNQGVRYLLATLLLDLADYRALQKLLKQYKDDYSATWKYTSALLAFRQEGKSKRANTLLREAIAYNRFVPLYLLSRKRFPKQLPPFVSPGNEDEAIHYVVEALRVWFESPGALDWLNEIFFLH